MNISLPCFAGLNDHDVNQSLDYYDTFQDNCKTCLASTIISIPLNFLTIYIIYKSQGKAVADGKLCDGAIHLMFLGKEGYQ